MLGFPIRTSADQCLVDGSPQLFAVTHVLHRFLAPRHPPLALRSLERTKLMFVKEQDARACSAVLKGRAAGPRMRLEVARSTPGQREQRSVPSPRSRPYGSTPSKRKRRQSSSSRRVKRTNPTIDLPFRRTHQCTNWEWFESGGTNAHQRLNCSP